MFPHFFTIAANETMPRDVSGSFVYVDKADGDIKLEAYNGGTRVADVPLSFAREANLPFFTKLYVTDTSGAENTVRLLVGGENEGYERNGSEITGPVGSDGGVQTEQIKPLGPNGGVSVEDAGNGYSFGELNTKLNYLRQAVEQSQHTGRAPYTSLANATHETVGNATKTIITAANNTGGVVLKTVSLVADSTGGRCRLDADGGPIAQVWGVSDSVHFKDIHIPAGVEVSMTSNNANAFGNVWYEAL